MHGCRLESDCEVERPDQGDLNAAGGGSAFWGVTLPGQRRAISAMPLARCFLDLCACTRAQPWPTAGQSRSASRNRDQAKRASHKRAAPRFRTSDPRLIARRLPAVTAGNPRGRHRRGDHEPAVAAGEDGSAQLRPCAGDRSRSAEARRPGLLRAGTGMPGHPRPVLAAAVAARWNASPAARRSGTPRR